MQPYSDYILEQLVVQQRATNMFLNRISFMLALLAGYATGFLIGTVIRAVLL